jgi:ribosome-associated protein
MFRTDKFLDLTQGQFPELFDGAGNVWDALKELGTLPRQARRTLGESWVLIDARDVMVHLFAEEARKFYSLEELWHSAPKVKFR